MTAPIYAIGDIHGHLDKLQDVLARIERDGGPDAQVVFLGDLVDRGPNSREVIELVMNGIKNGRNWIAIKGNHDRMMAYWLQGPAPDPQMLVGYHWLHERIGGIETLTSYGIEITDTARYYKVHPQVLEAVPQSHRDFLISMPYFHKSEDLLFVHAGIRPGIALMDQSNDDLCWIRRDFLDYTKPHPWLVVHGHTHRRSPEHHGNRVNLDTGAGHGRALTAAAFEGRDCWVLGENGREALRPGD
ncbi:metallophosphoesterase family protein [Shimia abyssi]|uniref:Serine/threonine protein phosphatase 1 n=1 Tax=Shimia abyssi TaxID=1662395 RepID=A0A2P8F4E4_9RHOB|nr:metallophosphoesterase family protein [Shimia abyssi]PSL16582.1 serine/threonine protein phosphatase 1 [Shimia abyssi]